MYCKYCGKELAEENAFCTRCGKPVHEQIENKEQLKRQIKPKKKYTWQIIIVVLLLIIVCIAIASWNKLATIKLGTISLDPEKKLVGTWYEVDDDGSLDYDEKIQFFSDGTFIGLGEDGTYAIVDGQLVFRFQWAVSKFVYVYDFDFKGNELYLYEEDGDEIILQKENLKGATHTSGNEELTEDVPITVFFDEGTTQEQIAIIGAQICQRMEVKDAVLTSGKDAWNELAGEYFTGSETVEAFGDENPLANSAHYTVYLNQIAELDELVDFIEGLDYVREVNKLD